MPIESFDCYQVSCDDCGESLFDDIADSFDPSPSDLREYGWVMIEHNVYCEDCAPKEHVEILEMLEESYSLFVKAAKAINLPLEESRVFQFGIYLKTPDKKSFDRLKQHLLMAQWFSSEDPEIFSKCFTYCFALHTENSLITAPPEAKSYLEKLTEDV